VLPGRKNYNTITPSSLRHTSTNEPQQTFTLLFVFRFFGKKRDCFEPSSPHPLPLVRKTGILIPRRHIWRHHSHWERKARAETRSWRRHADIAIATGTIVKFTIIVPLSAGGLALGGAAAAGVASTVVAVVVRGAWSFGSARVGGEAFGYSCVYSFV